MMKNLALDFVKMSFVVGLVFTGLLWSVPANAVEDLFEQSKADTGIAMIRFPQSLTVIQVKKKGGAVAALKILNDPAVIKKALRKIDPARIVPTKTGRVLEGPLTREALPALGKQYGTQLLLLFRRDVSEKEFATQGLVYFAKQNKIAPVPGNVKILSTDPDTLEKANRTSLKELANAARKTIHTYKFEKRQSNY